MPPPHRASEEARLLGSPFFRRYGVNLPSSLTEGRSFTWGELSLPTSVGLRYGQSGSWLAAFLGGMGARNFRAVTRARSPRQPPGAWICLRPGLPRRHLSCPVERLPFPTASPLHSSSTLRSGAGLSHLLAIAYDYNVLGLGPD